MAKVSFDGPNKTINILAGVTEIDVGTDLYSAWKHWTGSFELGIPMAAYAPAFYTIGGQPLNAEQTNFATPIYFLRNGWVLSCNTGETVNIRTNLFPDPNTGAANILITSNNSNLIVETTKGILIQGSQVTINEQLLEIKSLILTNM